MSFSSLRATCSQLLFVAALAIVGPGAHGATASQQATAILQATGVGGGFVVHLGCGDGSLTVALKANDSYQVHGLAHSAGELATARKTIQEADAYGEVAADLLSGDQLPYIDNLVNLVVVQDTAGISREEILRVLTPRGVAYFEKADHTWEKVVKPLDEKLDEWTHYLHDPGGNPVAHDDRVGPPRRLQWVGNPRWSRHHDRMASMSALVSANGRMFYIMDEGSRTSIQLPSDWKLVARDAFNGTKLWQRDIESWQPHLFPLKSGPTQLARRLVAVGDVVYATLGYEAPLTAINAVTGETIHAFEGSDATEEILVDGNRVFVVVNKDEAELKDFVPLFAGTGDQARVRNEFSQNEKPRVIMAFDVKTGEQLWAQATSIASLTIACDARGVYFHDGEKITALNRDSGTVQWTTAPATRRNKFTFNFGPRLVLHDDVILFAGGDKKMTAYSAQTGKQLWEAPHPNSGYESPQDLMVVDGLVWCAPTTSGRDTGVFTGRDPHTGEVKVEFPPNVDTYWFHHRCYIAKATDNFLIPSRTGIEFVDPKQKDWEIHHWVRGGCLYGVMPCNGLVYAPPHNCACYPEAKLYGFNALAPAATAQTAPTPKSDEERLEKGPAFGDVEPIAATDEDWPTFRHDPSRSGAASTEAPSTLIKQWSVDLGGRLTQPVIAGDYLYVAQTDRHTLHALNTRSGEKAWSYTIGARIDSPPTLANGYVVFGGADGWVYALRAGDGELAWRFQAAPADRRTMAFEQLESLWPVHGSVLVRDGKVYCVAGRSVFLDGGLRMLELDLATGKKIFEHEIDDRDPDTGENLQVRLKILQMPVGLPDILSSDGEHIFMRSQKFDFDGQRKEIGPVSGDFAQQGGAQTGEGVHLFAPMGFLDDSWFHRSYWVYGRNFAGGHGGYYQAGKFAPSGRILVHKDGEVFGYGRKPQYLRWTTELEHQLFSASDVPPGFQGAGGGGNRNGSMVHFPITPSLNPKGKPITVEAWVKAAKPGGVIVARGGPADGFALTIEKGKPVFHVRAANNLVSAVGEKRIVGQWHHVAGVLHEDGEARLYVDGQLAGSAKSASLLANDPVQGLEIGADDASAVGEYESPFPLAGQVDEVRLYFLAASEQAVRDRFESGDEISDEAVLAISFDKGASDGSRHRNNGAIVDAKAVDGKFGKAMEFAGTIGKRKGNQNAASKVKPNWTSDITVYARAMVASGDRLFIAGPPDIIDEAETFQGISQRDQQIEKLLERQDEVLNGAEGSMLLVVDAKSGETVGAVSLESLPVWDGMAAAQKKLFLSTADGKITCLGDE
ncbi:MAG: PQQ-binding-like beta-propeller repeat protein [Planctomycetales bacterium]|nr:PQQ-binding-like beta-propeller repeat protein [Planctomycetales bacterium]